MPLLERATAGTTAHGVDRVDRDRRALDHQQRRSPSAALGDHRFSRSAAPRADHPRSTDDGDAPRHQHQHPQEATHARPRRGQWSGTPRWPAPGRGETNGHAEVERVGDRQQREATVSRARIVSRTAQRLIIRSICRTRTDPWVAERPGADAVRPWPDPAGRGRTQRSCRAGSVSAAGSARQQRHLDQARRTSVSRREPSISTPAAAGRPPRTRRTTTDQDRARIRSSWPGRRPRTGTLSGPSCGNTRGRPAPGLAEDRVVGRRGPPGGVKVAVRSVTTGRPPAAAASAPGARGVRRETELDQRSRPRISPTMGRSRSAMDSPAMTGRSSRRRPRSAPPGRVRLVVQVSFIGIERARPGGRAAANSSRRPGCRVNRRYAARKGTPGPAGERPRWFTSCSR